jgi:hypothetical protein
MCPSHASIRFQLVLFWSTSLRSRELTPKRELRLGKPASLQPAKAAAPKRCSCEGGLAGSNCLSRRFDQSQELHTAPRRPWHRHVIIEFPDEARAIRFERYLKSGSGRAFAKRHFEE